ncbi:MAG: hypothetical protein PVH00_06285 [Gemmatimonadota bacterium]
MRPLDGLDRNEAGIRACAGGGLTVDGPPEVDPLAAVRLVHRIDVEDQQRRVAGGGDGTDLELLGPDVAERPSRRGEAVPVAQHLGRQDGAASLDHGEGHPLIGQRDGGVGTEYADDNGVEQGLVRSADLAVTRDHREMNIGPGGGGGLIAAAGEDRDSEAENARSPHGDFQRSVTKSCGLSRTLTNLQPTHPGLQESRRVFRVAARIRVAYRTSASSTNCRTMASPGSPVR